MADKNILLTKFESMTECDSQKGAISTYPVDIPGTSRPVKNSEVLFLAPSDIRLNMEC
jgi:hypothetical protein